MNWRGDNGPTYGQVLVVVQFVVIVILLVFMYKHCHFWPITLTQI